jgi:hypothetical protein
MASSSNTSRTLIGNQIVEAYNQLNLLTRVFTLERQQGHMILIITGFRKTALYSAELNEHVEKVKTTLGQRGVSRNIPSDQADSLMQEFEAFLDTQCDAAASGYSLQADALFAQLDPSKTGFIATSDSNGFVEMRVTATNFWVQNRTLRQAVNAARNLAFKAVRESNQDDNNDMDRAIDAYQSLKRFASNDSQAQKLKAQEESKARTWQREKEAALDMGSPTECTGDAAIALCNQTGINMATSMLELRRGNDKTLTAKVTGYVQGTQPNNAHMQARAQLVLEKLGIKSSNQQIPQGKMDAVFKPLRAMGSDEDHVMAISVYGRLVPCILQVLDFDLNTPLAKSCRNASGFCEIKFQGFTLLSDENVALEASNAYRRLLKSLKGGYAEDEKVFLNLKPAPGPQATSSAISPAQTGLQTGGRSTAQDPVLRTSNDGASKAKQRDPVMQKPLPAFSSLKGSTASQPLAVPGSFKLALPRKPVSPSQPDPDPQPAGKAVLPGPAAGSQPALEAILPGPALDPQPTSETVLPEPASESRIVTSHQEHHAALFLPDIPPLSISTPAAETEKPNGGQADRYFGNSTGKDDVQSPPSTQHTHLGPSEQDPSPQCNIGNGHPAAPAQPYEVEDAGADTQEPAPPQACRVSPPQRLRPKSPRAVGTSSSKNNASREYGRKRSVAYRTPAAKDAQRGLLHTPLAPAMSSQPLNRVQDNSRVTPCHRRIRKSGIRTTGPATKQLLALVAEITIPPPAAEMPAFQLSEEELRLVYAELRGRRSTSPRCPHKAVALSRTHYGGIRKQNRKSQASCRASKGAEIKRGKKPRTASMDSESSLSPVASPSSVSSAFDPQLTAGDEAMDLELTDQHSLYFVDFEAMDFEYDDPWAGFVDRIE